MRFSMLKPMVGATSRRDAQKGSFCRRRGGCAVLQRSIAGAARRATRKVEFSACAGSFGALEGVFCVEFDAEDDGELRLSSGRLEMGANGASGVTIGVAGRGAVLSGRVADDDRFHWEPGSFSGFCAYFEAWEGPSSVEFYAEDDGVLCFCRGARFLDVPLSSRCVSTRRHGCRSG